MFFCTVKMVFFSLYYNIRCFILVSVKIVARSQTSRLTSLFIFMLKYVLHWLLLIIISYIWFSGSVDKCVRLWTIKDANPVRLFLGSKGTVYSLSFSPKGHHLVTAGEDRRIRIWDLVASKQLAELRTGKDPITKLAICSDGMVLATGTVDGVVKLWDFTAILQRPGETVSMEPISQMSLNYKLLDVEESFRTFGCLTVQQMDSMPLWIQVWYFYYYFVPLFCWVFS